MLDSINNHNELLHEILPNFIKTRKGFTGCYIAEMNYPGKEIA